MSLINKLFMAAVVLCAIAFQSITVGAYPAEDAFKKAAEFYVEGKYDEAIREYYKPIQEGYESGNLYYNMGNCFLKKNNIGYAILYYEKAKRLIPADDDLKANYEFAESLIKNRQSVTSRPWLNRQLDRAYNPLTNNALMILILFFYVMIFAVLTAGIFIDERIREKYSTVAISAAAALLIISSYVLYERVSGVQSVVLAGKVEARYEPFEKATVFFTLSEGMKVEVIDTDAQWYKIKRPDGKAGWTPKNDIGLI
ncbi:MAG: SH3 domain-containing protein [Nitrospirae bacterium]|nr:SH3 domain-containing protein [Nitrospirota bacterium]